MKKSYLFGLKNGKFGWLVSVGDQFENHNILEGGSEMLTVTGIEGKTLKFVDDAGVSGEIVLG